MSLERTEPNYFGAGPALLPTSVLQQAAKDMINFQGLGLGAGEISHRSAAGGNIIESTKKHLAELLDVPDTHEVFFMQGGGTTGFSAVPTNLSASFAKKTGKKGKPAYVITGSWSKKAAEEAQRLGFDPEIVVDSKKVDGKFGGIPAVEKWSIPADLSNTSYVYFCDNETVNGVEFPDFPFDKFPGVEIVADMSSNFLSKKIDVSKYGCILAGAQKNVGLAGITIYIIKKSLLEYPSDEELTKLNIPLTPIAFEFPIVVKNNSAYNTVPTFTVHIVDLVLQLLAEKGGLANQQKVNEEKAKLLYAALDKYPSVFNLPVEKSVRSKMNVVFTLAKGTDSDFLNAAEEKKLQGLKGHRSVGGMRASLYNAVSLDSVKLLCEFVEDFGSKNA
ncbi:hypothetical protein OGAPHI_001577 [Ogataea philodendri]|uniref:phosphoserine transaminase n=1 Tax=Ogataea philodendri TaxID=1378263 RepID=A0A9P8T8Y3_9ASCO|nr:uncharacterized protein OGAPHI_001577 [Ogataea philodendri]KAH3669456.1 hypothetical protein OGAPHI_001577 [Ogataea philodendri]